MKPPDPDAEWVAGHGHLRVSDEDRERMVEFLKTAFVQGRLSRGELTDRAGQAYQAKTGAQLVAVTADIPAGRAPAAEPHQAAPARTRTRTQVRQVNRKAIAKVLSTVVVLSGLGVAAVATYYGGFIILFLLAFFAVAWLDSYDSPRARRHRMC